MTFIRTHRSLSVLLTGAAAQIARTRIPALPALLLLALAAAACSDDRPADGGQVARRQAWEPADMVLFHGRIMTMNDDNPEVHAVAVRDGRIIAVGKNDPIRAYIGPETEQIDLKGKFVMPGFIEGHGHFLGLGDAKLTLDLTSARSWSEIVELVARAVAEAGPGEWIRGRGWHQDEWDSAPSPAVEGFPVHAALSAASPENPVYLTHASGHASMVNARAMTLAGIDRSTPDPEGGEILKDRQGRPTGLLRETAQSLARRVWSGVPERQRLAENRRRALLAATECLKKGVTSFQDAGSSLQEIDDLKSMVDMESLPVRLWVMIREPNEVLEDSLAGYRMIGHGDDHLTVRAIKVSIDGALGSRGAWLLEPYSDAPETTGLNLVPVDEVRRTAELALEHDYQLCVHAIGDRANREVLDIYEAALGGRRDRDLRWRIEHAQHLHPDDISRFASLGVVASMQTVHCTSDGSWVPDRIGERRAEQGAYVWRKLLESGALISNGTDVPVEDIDPIANFHSAVTRRLPDGSTFHPDQSMTRMEALKSATIHAARAAFEDDLKGSIEVGKLADMVVLSQDLLEVPEEEIRDVEVLTTIIGGRVEYSK